MTDTLTRAPKTPYQEFLKKSRVGYFSMEIAVSSDISTYSGGLGVLAGDTLRSAADLEIPMVGVTLVSRDGYFRQKIDAAGRQVELPDPWDVERWTTDLPAKVSVPIGSRNVWIRAWLYVVEGLAGGQQPVILLDTDLPENAPADRDITDRLYGGDQAYRLKQEIVLGIGGVRMLEALGFVVDLYHLNEGHSALLTLQLLQRSEHAKESLRSGEGRYDFARVRERCHFTTHTPLEAGHDRFPYGLVRELMGNFIDHDALVRLGGRDELNMTRLAMNMCEYVNGVAERHAKTSERLYPGYHVSAITNGVHPFTWTHPAIAKLYDAELPGWCLEPELLMRADCCLSGAELWSSHIRAKNELIELVRRECAVDLDPNVPIIGYGRRMTHYKRPDLLFSDLSRLERIASEQPFQVVLAGKAHPRDETGKRAIEFLTATIRALDGKIRAAFLPNYDMAIGLAMVSGADVWLNTPQPPLEASGTSGMKATFNGVPNLSTLDGWWLEGHIEGITGWAIGNGEDDPEISDATSLYDKLERVVLPLYSNREAWIALMKGTISRNASMFHSHRMMRRYAAEAYLR